MRRGASALGGMGGMGGRPGAGGKGGILGFGQSTARILKGNTGVTFKYKHVLIINTKNKA